MAIDFFKAGCISKASEPVFGIYDVPPAALRFEDSDNWHVWVDNADEEEVTFVAVDQCLDIPWNEGERCEALLTFKDVLMFVELKDRDGGRWAGKSRDQLINTIKLFKRDADMSPYRRFLGHIANKQRPYFKSGGKAFFEKFEDETGFILRVNNVIKIE